MTTCSQSTVPLFHAETEGFDLIGQITPYTYAEALHLLPSMASELVVRLEGLKEHGNAAHAANLAEREAALQHLLGTQLPEMMQQYTQQLQQAAASMHAQQHPLADAVETADDTAAIADLLGLAEEVPASLAGVSTSEMAAGAVHDELLDAEYQSEEDLHRATQAVGQTAPDIFDRLQAETHSPATFRESSDDPFAEDFHQDLTPFWETPQDVAYLDSETNDGEPWTSPNADGSLESGDGADVFELLFSSDADAQEGAAASDLEQPIVSPAAQAADQLASSPAEVSAADSTDVAAVCSDSATLQGIAGSSATSTADSADLLSTLGDGVIASVADGHGADQAAAEEPRASDAYNFDEFVASLSLQQQSQLSRSADTRDNALAKLPSALQLAVQDMIDILEDLVAAYSHNTSSRAQAAGQDVAVRQMLHKIICLWQQLCSPSTCVSDPLFLFRDGPVTKAVRRGSMLLLEDFDAPSQAVTERLNSMLEPEPTFAVTEDITLSGNAEVPLPPGFQVRGILLGPICFTHQSCACYHSAILHNRAFGTYVYSVLNCYSQLLCDVILLHTSQPGHRGKACVETLCTRHRTKCIRILVTLMMLRRCACCLCVQVFATVHQSSSTQRLNLSPATRSRFTTVAAIPYTSDETHSILQRQLADLLCCPGGGGKERGASSRDVQQLLTLIFGLKSTTEQELKVQVNIRQLLSCVHFVAAHTCEPSWTRRLLVGFRWLVIDTYQPDPHQQLQMAAKWLQGHLQDTSGTVKDLQQHVDAAFQLPDSLELQHMPLLVQAGAYVQLAYTGVAAAAAATTTAEGDVALLASPLSRLHLSCTASVVTNMARIFAATTVRGSLLLEGPPGIGKTAVVQQVAAVLGVSCERINLSANTTTEQLFGSFVPQVLAGQRVFAWQDGVLVRAVRQGKWLLLDEINLAPSEVLAALAPILDRCVGCSRLLCGSRGITACSSQLAQSIVCHYGVALMQTADAVATKIMAQVP